MKRKTGEFIRPIFTVAETTNYICNVNNLRRLKQRFTFTSAEYSFSPVKDVSTIVKRCGKDWLYIKDHKGLWQVGGYLTTKPSGAEVWIVRAGAMFIQRWTIGRSVVEFWQHLYVDRQDQSTIEIFGFNIDGKFWSVEELQDIGCAFDHWGVEELTMFRMCAD